MLGARSWLLLALAVFGVLFAVAWIRAVRRSRSEGRADRLAPGSERLATGFVTNFFDTLGIGSFATTTSIFKLRRLVADERIPGTLNVGHTPPTIVQAFIFIVAVKVEMLTLFTMIAAAVVGAWLGAGVVARWPRRRIQVGMGCALLAAASLMLASLLHIMPFGGQALGLSGGRLVLAAAINFVLGALMTLGIGLYAPCMILVSVLGMSPLTAFPIMMGSCAFLMPVGSIQFLRLGRYDLRAALGLTLGGIPAVLLAFYLIQSLPLTAVRWLVIAVVVYTATAMLRSALANGRAEGAVDPSPYEGQG
jgi:uncharacterized membrane protein YfcA